MRVPAHKAEATADKQSVREQEAATRTEKIGAEKPTAEAEKPAPSVDNGKSDAIEQGATEYVAAANRADEGEFRHLSASATTGLELLGKIVRQIRKYGGEYAVRVKQLFERGVNVKERKDAIAFVVPDASYLSMGEPGVMVELNTALKAIGIEKPARIERTADDIRANDIAVAERLFGEFAVFENKTTA